MSIMKHFDHLKIDMKDIATATNNFDPSKVIGVGGFRRVYKGELSLPDGQITAAFKRLDRTMGQGTVEFWNEIEMLSKYIHENLISLMHFCIQGDEMILTYEYASRGSLDRYLSDASTLTWTRRLKICLGAARGINYLHDPMGTQQRVFHRDIKSANILLDDNWTAKVSDFGLSRVGPANQEHTYVLSNAAGTYGYCDPVYVETGILTKESDVYSLGVVLFEVLCGRFCFEASREILVPNWRKCYEDNRLDEIILVGLKEQMDRRSLYTFSTIAYQCVKRAREERPLMVEIVKGLELAFLQQVGHENSGSQSSWLVSDAGMGPINKDWVCCDKCEKWRLLPPDLNPGSLPRKWLCSMLNWLPGMNRCSIIEEETTKATISLYRNGKTTKANIPSLLEHQSCVSVDTPAPGPLDVYQTKNLDGIVTQNSALGDIIKAIEDESIQIIGIYGLGGVGKTTLAKEVVARVKNIFDDVAFTTISQTVNAENIKKDIEKATKQIMQGKKILIILDDVWEKLNLEDLCIPCGINYMNCKILLTSRSIDVCNKMNVQSKICVESLPIEEAWILFKSVVGERVENDVSLREVAMKVAEECGGLPLLIQAVGNALKNKDIDLWNSALIRLKKHAPAGIDPDIKKAFIHLKLSYDYLESEEAKSCFLLCSMFPEDDDIYLEDLVNYQVGLKKFNDLESMEDARQRVQNSVIMLMSSGLLLEGDDKEATKMHDVVRDVALLVASEGNNKFLVEAGKGLTEWLPRKDAYESYTGISLMGNEICKLPDYEIHFPYLDALLLQFNQVSVISEEFIGGMKEVRVLDMTWNKISSLPQSLNLLTKLRMLNLAYNKSLHDISILGGLKDLEILILNETGIKEIPKKIGQLVNLRRLEVKDCHKLSHIAPGVISKLRWLEELFIHFYEMHEGIYDTIVDVMNLSKLSFLVLRVPCLDVIPQDFNSGKLKGLSIEIRESLGSVYEYSSERCLILGMSCLKIPFPGWIKNFSEASPYIVLRDTENLNNILPTLYDEGFNKLEHIQLVGCPNVSCLVDTTSVWDKLQISKDQHHLGEEGKKTKEKFLTKLKTLSLGNLTSLEVLWNCPDEYISLSNLVTLNIIGCRKLVRVFSVSVAWSICRS